MKHKPKPIPPEYGFLTLYIANFFRFLQKYSLSQLFIQNRVDAFAKSGFADLSGHDRKRQAIKRARKIDRYICACILAEIIGVALVSRASLVMNGWIRWPVMIFAILRLVDIVQVNINLSLFDVLRTGREYHYMASVVRSIINVILNYFEIILCFGILYRFNEQHLDKARGWTDAFYFSVVSQVTIGFGEIMPGSSLRWLTALQFILGYFFTALIIGRFISLLPHGRTVAGDGQSDQE
jgi:hypothetical protein